MPVKILLADDSITIQKIVHQTFENEPVELTLLNNGEAAIRHLEESTPDLVLADVFMPGKNGYEVCEFIKQRPETSAVPVILLVGAFEPFDEKEAARVQADDHLKKPFAPKMLMDAIRRYLSWEREESAAEQPPISLGEEIPAPSPDTTVWHPEQSAFLQSIEEPAEREPAPGAERISSTEMTFVENVPVSSESATESAAGAEAEMPLEISHLDEVSSAGVVEEEPVLNPDAETTGSIEAPPLPEIDEAASSTPTAEEAPIYGPPVTIPTTEPSGRDEFAEFQEHLALHSDNQIVLTPAVSEMERPRVSVSPVLESRAPATMEELMGAPPPPISGPEALAPETVGAAAATDEIPSSTPPALSEEMIDAIARRVVEKMSSRVIEEIAWEVIPDLAETILKKNIAEKK